MFLNNQVACGKKMFDDIIEVAFWEIFFVIFPVACAMCPYTTVYCKLAYRNVIFWAVCSEKFLVGSTTNQYLRNLLRLIW